MKKGIIMLVLMSFFLYGMRPQSLVESVIITPPDQPVKLIFIHHSTGGNWLADSSGNELGGGLGRALMENNYYVSATNYGWGPDSIGDVTDIPNWMDWFRGERSTLYLDAVYNENGQNFGDFGSWPRMADDPGGQNSIILFKSCFPNSDLEGRPNDPPDPDGWLTVGHAKYVYNEILKYFASRPDKLFVVITAPPLIHSTNAKNARAFNDWLVNDWLNENNYNLRNVAVFDFYNVLTGPDNHHRVVNGRIEHTYKQGQNLEYYPSGDDHPSQTGNRKATDEFIPLLNAFYNNWAATAPQEAPQPIQDTQQATQQPLTFGGTSDLFAIDFEDGALDWVAYDDGGGATSLVCGPVSDQAFSGSQSLHMAFNVAAEGWATCGLDFEGAQDWSSGSGLTFAVRVADPGTTLHVDLYAGNSDARESYYFVLEDPSAEGWTQVSIPWSDFRRVDWEENAGAAFTKPDLILGLAFGMPSGGQGALWVDDLQVYGAGEQPAPAVAESTQPPEQMMEEPALGETAGPASGSRLRLPFCGGGAIVPLAGLIFSFNVHKRKIIQ